MIMNDELRRIMEQTDCCPTDIFLKKANEMTENPVWLVGTPEKIRTAFSMNDDSERHRYSFSLGPTFRRTEPQRTYVRIYNFSPVDMAASKNIHALCKC
jgi:hypothetical protein